MEYSEGIDQEIYQVFLTEALEQLESYSQTLLVLEKNPTDEAALNEIFRIAHSLKGNAGAVGHENIKEVMHAAEDVLGAARAGELRLTVDEFDILLNVNDATTRFLTEGTPFDAQEWISRLRVLTGKTQKQTRTVDPTLILDVREKQLVSDWQEQGKSIYNFELGFSDEAPLKAATSMLLLRELRGYGEVFKTVPGAEEIAEEQYSCLIVVCVLGQDLSAEDQEKLSGFATASHGVTALTWRKWACRNEQSGAGEEETSKRHEDKSVFDTIRVDSQKLERLLNTVGDLISIRAGLEETIHQGNLWGAGVNQLKGQMYHFNQTLGVLQTEVMQLRMAPIRQLFSRFPRIVRDLARKNGKAVELIFEGDGTEIDKKVMELLVDPLTHLIRNAVDHGIETEAERTGKGKEPTGRIILSAAQQGNNIMVTISDDGSGVDLEKVRAKAIASGLAREGLTYTPKQLYQFLFEPGFSTAAKVTDISGRGVGLDVVKSNLGQINGTVEIESEMGKGTVFRLVVPLTLAIIHAFLMEVSGQAYAVPALDVVENISVSNRSIQEIGGVKVIRLRNQVVGLLDASELFYTTPTEVGRQQPVVILGNDKQKVGLLVGEFLGYQEIMIKPVNPSLDRIDYVSGVTVLGNGRVALIINPLALLNSGKAV